MVRPWSSFGFALGLTVAAPAVAAQLPPDPSPPATAVSGVDATGMIDAADWITKPGAFKLFSFLPKRFTKPGIQGKVVLKCRILPNASATDCSVVSDTGPDGVLGEAALKASKLFQIKPRTVNGTPSDSAWVLIPIDYNLSATRL